MKRYLLCCIGIMCIAYLSLAGCGSGTDSTDSSSGSSSSSGTNSSNSGFITWNGNANGTVVKDANNNSFQFRASDGAMYDGSNYYNNVNVSGSDVIFNGSKYGYVGSATSTSGSTIAVLKCTSGSYMSISSGTLTCTGSSSSSTSTSGSNTSSTNTSSSNTSSASGSWVSGTYTVTAWGSDKLYLDSYVNAWVTDSSGSASFTGQYLQINNSSTKYTANYSSNGYTGTLKPGETKLLNIPFNNGTGSNYQSTKYQLWVQWFKEN